ncbi:MAG: ISL3 family transposase [Actinomycetota bacterium]|nr:ISL3 family transposase [Actinomycetota bacterium]
MELDGSDLASALVGMAGLFVIKAVETDDLWVLVETRPGVVACSACGVRAESKGRPVVLVRDLEIAGRATVLVWRKRRWVCWDTAWRAFETLVPPRVDDPDRIGGVEALGIDETAFLAATPTQSTRWATGLVDVRRGLLVDVIEGRSAGILRSWLAARPPEWASGVSVVSIDPFEAYRSRLVPHLSHAVVLADPFHIVRLANRAVDRVLRRTQRDQLGHRGRKGDPLYDARKILLTGFERINPRGWGRLNIALDAADPRNEVLAAFLAKEHLREVYATLEATRADRLLGQVIDECAETAIPELVTLANTLARWRTEIINRHRSGDSNGPTEAMNLLIKNIKRAGCGYRNFHHYRLRLLAHCGIGWKTRRIARLRGPTPQLTA